MKSYYHAIIEVDIPKHEMPHGADSPLREALHEAARGIHAKAEVLNIWSGWGLTKKGAMRTLNESCKQENTISDRTCTLRDDRRRNR